MLHWGDMLYHVYYIITQQNTQSLAEIRNRYTESSTSAALHVYKCITIRLEGHFVRAIRMTIWHQGTWIMWERKRRNIDRRWKWVAQHTHWQWQWLRWIGYELAGWMCLFARSLVWWQSPPLHEIAIDNIWNGLNRLKISFYSDHCPLGYGFYVN